MSEYNNEYCQTHDIDFFFRHNGKVYHVASNGDKVPSWINEESNSRIQESIYQRIDSKGNNKYETKVNAKIILDILTEQGYFEYEDYEEHDGHLNQLRRLPQAIDDYAKSFKEMAELGLWSYDTIEGKKILISCPNDSMISEDLFAKLNLPSAPDDYLNDFCTPPEDF